VICLSRSGWSSWQRCNGRSTPDGEGARPRAPRMRTLGLASFHDCRPPRAEGSRIPLALIAADMFQVWRPLSDWCRSCGSLTALQATERITSTGWHGFRGVAVVASEGSLRSISGPTKARRGKRNATPLRRGSGTARRPIVGAPSFSPARLSSSKSDRRSSPLN
jgi:hypothetical protein